MVEPLIAAAGIQSEAVLHSISFIIAFSIITYLHIVLGEMAPKSVSIRRAEKTTLLVAIPLDAWESIIEEIEDMKGYLRSKAVLDDPKSVFIPLEEAEKNWFDNNIKKVRKKKRVTKKELAKRRRVSKSRISQIEDPDHRPTSRVYERVAKALGCGLEDLI